MTFRRPIMYQRNASFRIKRKGWLLILFFIILVLFVVLYTVERTIEPLLLAIAKTELKKTAQEAVLVGIKDVASSQQVEDLMSVEKDDQGKIVLLKVNPKVQADLYSQVTAGVQKELKQLNGQSMKLSLGQLFQSPVLSAYGPKIPIQIWPKGASKVSLKPKMESAGINTVMVSLTLQIHSEMGVIVPFSEESTIVDVSYPLGEMIVVGEVPEYYFYSEQGEVKPLPTLPTPQ